MPKKLLNGCSYSDIWVKPKNWKTVTTQKSLKEEWYVECKFYDPKFADKYPKGFPFRKRLNRYYDLNDRKDAVRAMLEEIPKILEDDGFNPITKTFMLRPVITDMVLPDTPAIDALRKIHSTYSASKGMLKDIELTINNVDKSMKLLKLPTVRIFDFKIGKIKMILDNLKLTPNQYNKFLTNLSLLISELVEFEAMEHNPIKDMKRKKTVKKLRETLTIEEFREIAGMLEVNFPTFYRYAMIFFESGSRTAELFRVQAKDVNLLKQEYKVVIQKGKQYTEVVKVIMPDVLNFWVDLMQDVMSAEEYIFSRNLEPGSDPIAGYQITKRWKRLVKDRYGFINGKLVSLKTNPKAERITADFYSLKHLFLDILDVATGKNTAGLSAKLASHTTNITNTVYLVTKETRKNEILKKTRINIFEESA